MVYINSVLIDCAGINYANYIMLDFIPGANQYWVMIIASGSRKYFDIDMVQPLKCVP